MNPTILNAAAEETPTAAPNENPFLSMVSQSTVDEEERRDADGITGEMLDQMLRTRHVEGQKLGRRQALEEARGQFAQIWDDAHTRGRQVGVADSTRATVQIVATPVSHAIAAILAAKGKSGSAAVKVECEAAAAQLAALYQQVTGQLPEGYSFPDTPTTVADAG